MTGGTSVVSTLPPMNERAYRPPVAFFLSATLLSVGCQKEADKPEWDVDVALPLIRTTLTIGDLIGDTLIGTDGQGNVSIVYSTRLFELRLDTLLSSPDTSFHYSYPDSVLGSGSLPFNAGFPYQALDELIRFDLDEFELRELRVRSGELGLSLTNRLATVLLTTFSLPGTALNGIPLTATPTLPPGSLSSPATIFQTIPLDGYSFDLRGPQFDNVNTLAMTLSIEAETDVILTTPESLEVVVNYHDIIPQYARGYFGTRDINMDPDTSELNVFDGMSGLLDIDEATATLKVRNGVGVDARAEIAYIRSVNRSTGSVVDLDHTITTSPLNLDRALDLGSTFQPATNAYTLNTTNSNIDAFIENLPDAIAFDMDVTIDPLGDVSNGNDFFYHESTLSADLDVDIPLRLIASNLSLSRKTTVELDGTLEHHAFQYGTLHFFATNRFPFSAGIALDIVTADNVVLGTLTPGGTIASGQLGPDGLVTSATATQLDFAVSKEQLDLFYPGSAGGPLGARLRIGVNFNTADQSQHVQLRSDYTIDILATLEGNYIVNGDE